MNSRYLWVIVVLGVAACSSGGDSGTPPSNEPPTLSFKVDAIAVVKNVPIDLTVTVDDPDDDPLTITWEATRGALTPQNSQSTVVEWATPATAGTDTVTVSVTDGTATASRSVQIKVGTLVTTVAPGIFTRANSPYIIRPDASLVTAIRTVGSVIEAGVELLIDRQNSYFNVTGNFEAHGTADQPIVMRPNNRNFTCSSNRGWWEGIRAVSDDAQASDGFLDFEHVEIRNAKWGVRLRDNASALLRDCRILCSGTAGLLIEGNGSLRALDSRISDGAGDGIAIAAITSLPDSVRIEGCTISFNDAIGLRMDINDLGMTVPIIVEFNQFLFNDVHGISLAHAVFPSIHYNVFLGNGDESVSNLFLTGGYPDPVNLAQLDATCNFWGAATTSQATIDASIRDSYDTGTVHTRVVSCPWLNVNPITETPVCNMTCP